MGKKLTKIIYFGHQSEIGGGEVSLLQLIKNLDQEKFEPIIIVSNSGPFFNEVKNLNIKYYNLNLKSEFIKETAATSLKKNPIKKLKLVMNLIDAASKIRKILKSEKPCIVHSNTLKSATIIGIALLGLGIKHIYHDRTFTFNFVNKLVYLFTSKIIVISNYVGTKYKIKKKIVKIYNGVDRGNINLEEDIKSSDVNEQIRIAMVGRITPWKGQHVFIEAAINLLGRNQNAQFYLYGSDAIEKHDGYLENLVDTVSQSGYTDNIHFKGFKRDIYDIIKSMDIIVVPSIEPEPFGRIVVEAMMMGKVVIASEIGGIPELIENNKDGYLIEPNNPDLLEQKLFEIINSFEKQKRIKNCALESFNRKFTIDKHVEAVELLYKELT